MSKWVINVSDETPTSKEEIMEIFSEYGIHVANVKEVENGYRYHILCNSRYRYMCK